MAKKIVRLTQNQMTKLVKRVIKENEYTQGPDEDYFEGQEDNTDLVSLVRDRLASLPNNSRKIKVLEAIKSIIDMEIKIIRRQN